jgi:hypothetical protein
MAKSKKAAPTLGSLLPSSQAKLLTASTKKLTKQKLETALNKHPHKDLSHKDMSGLRKLAISRINEGQSAFTWSGHNFTDHEVSQQDPSTCICF